MWHISVSGSLLELTWLECELKSVRIPLVCKGIRIDIDWCINNGHMKSWQLNFNVLLMKNNVG